MGELLQAMRKRVPLTQEELADRAQLSVGTIRGLESGRTRRPHSGSLRHLADALGLSEADRRRLITAAQDDPTSPAIASQLPPAIVDFTGREAQVARLEGILLGAKTDSKALVITAMAGRGGVGKTTLAVHMAHRLADQFSDGQLYVDMHGTQAEPVEPSQVLARFLRVLGVAESMIPDGLDERAELYRNRIASRRCLVVVDNASSAAQVRPLLPGTAGCAALITSRRRLTSLEGAQLVDLGVFDTAEACELLGKLAGPDRAAAQVSALRRLAELCGHLPLAVRIAGARLAARPHWSVTQLVERLADERQRLDELAADDLDVRASIGLGYVNLKDDTRRAFRLLGLLESPHFSDWTVAAMMDCEVRKAIDLLDHLVTAQLIEVVDAAATRACRYRLHDLVRLYALERADEEESEESRHRALRRALGGWLALAEQADDQMPSRYFARIAGDAPRSRADDTTAESLLGDPMAWFEAERGALSAAVAQACVHGLDELAWELASSAHLFFDWHSFLDDWERTHSLALACCRRTSNILGVAVMARNLTDLCEQRGRDRLLGCADEAIAASRRIGNRLLEADCMIQWGVLHRHDDIVAARTSIEAGLALADEEHYVLGACAGRLWLGVLHYEAGAPATTALYAEEFLALARHHDHIGGQFQALRLLGVASRELALYEQSEGCFLQALDIIRAIGNRTEETRVLTSLGELYLRWDVAKARPMLEQGLELAGSLGDDFGRAYALRVLGELDLAEQRYDSALVHLRSALAYHHQMALAHQEAQTLRALGEVHSARGDAQAAHSAWAAARRLWAQLGNTVEADRVSR